MNALTFARTAKYQLSCLSGGEFVDLWYKLKMEFFHKFQNPFIFSTRISGPDFFDTVTHHLETGKDLLPIEGEKLGEYDANFNKWLRNQKS